MIIENDSSNCLQASRISVRYSGAAPTSCTDATTGNVLAFTYNFDSDPGAGVINNGNVASIANNRAPNRSQSFTYDELNRIKTAQSAATSGGDCWGLQFGYDIWANLLSASVTKCSAPILGVTATTKNQMSGFCYDSAGNLILNFTCPQPLGALTYTYDAENRMTQSVVSGVTTAYVYDGDGKRVKKGTAKLYWYGLGADPMEETNASGAASADFIFFGGKRTARLDLPGAAAHYYFADHLGSTNVVTSSTGTIQDESEFYPFGGEHVVTNTDPNAYKFTGKERDTESNLDEFGARYYSSQLGRFTIPDWAGAPTAVPYADFGDPQTLNLYSYVRNNPLSHADFDGHCCSASEVADWIDSKVQSFRQDGLSANSHASPTVAAINTFANGVTGDIASGIADTLRLGEGTAAAIDSAKQGDYAGAAVGLAQDGGRAAGVILTVAGLAPGPKGAPASAAEATKPAAPPGENAPAAAGRAAHAEFAQKVQAKPGWQSQPSLKDPATGKTVRPDAVTKSGRPVELKPNTPSGRASGKSQLPKYERATGKKGRVVYYD